MNKIISYSIKHPVSIFMYFILLTILGIICLTTISMDFLPRIKEHTLLVSTVYPGMSAEQMREIITIPVETSFSSLRGLKTISSVTRDNCCFVKIELHNNVNINNALIDSRQIIDQLENQLPQDCIKPEVDIYNSDKNLILKLAITSNNKTIPEIRKLAETELKHSLQVANGIGHISIIGGYEDQIQITYDPFKLHSLNLTPDYISTAIINTNYEFPAGLIKDVNNEYILKTSALFKNIEDINNVKLLVSDSILNLEELAKPVFFHSNMNTFCFINSKECISLSIKKKNNANPIKTINDIKKILAVFSSNHDDIDISIIQDTSIEIRHSIFSVLFSALLSTIITFLVIYYFFRNKIISVILSLPIPLCILFTFICLKSLNHSINLFSLSGISISIGMLVDASIVVLENIISNQSNISNDSKIYNAVIQVKSSTINSVLTTIIVFTPFFFIPGNFGELFSDLSISVITSIFLSGIISLTLVPACYKQFIYSNQNYNSNIFIISKLENRYRIILNHLLDTNKCKIYLALFIISFLCIPLAIFTKKEFSPKITSLIHYFTIELPPNQTMTKSQKQVKEIILNFTEKFPDCTIYTVAGLEPSDFENLADVKSNPYNVTFTIILPQKDRLKNIINFFNDQNFIYQHTEAKDFMAKSLDLSSSHIYSCNTLDEIYAFSKITPDAIPNFKMKEYTFIPDQIKLEHYKIPSSYISNYAYNYLEGIECGTLKKENKDIPIILKPESKFNSYNSIFIPINNQTIPLSTLGKFQTSEKDKIYFRYNRKDSKIINNPSQTQNLISPSKEKIYELLTSSILLIIFILILLYCLLGAQLESFTTPLILLVSILPGFTGSLLSLIATRNSLNLNSLLSLIVLSGISINNSIILLESVSLYKKISKLKFVKILSSRLKPILITTITSILSLLPFMFIKTRNNSQSSMAIALCGGLLSSVISSLLFIPILLKKKVTK
ncbi:MAG: efflux RND transporter permease subunit [Treponema sp.]|uniref:efflux RND transporter permease subunit n=1 Tax=Treponema sp. TaxID=166 RepID=UPI00298E0C85|nr:efflux RND transporter permease subunit [Treponema sp.]MCQ2600817.1 efflux RND transporter permease subunit [Treponema sp.]